MATLADTLICGSLCITDTTCTNGIAPVGAIIPIVTNLTGSFSIPASGTVSSQGWMVCDGATVPADQTLSGDTPNLTDNRFLMGYTSSGVCGGANSIGIEGCNLPSHTHTAAAHNHTASASINCCNIYTTCCALGHSHTYIGDSPDNWVGGVQQNPNVYCQNPVCNTGGSLGGRCFQVCHKHTATITVDSCTPDSTGSCGCGCPLATVPKYFTAQYIIRVK